MTKAKKKSVIVIALIALLALTVFQSLAYFQESQDGVKAVKNTFVAAGGGKLIDPNSNISAPAPTESLTDGFFLVEHQVAYKPSLKKYEQVGDNVFTIQNTYDKVVPKMEIFKDPMLTVNLADGAEAYVFVKVTDSTKENFDYEINGNWKEITSDFKTLQVAIPTGTRIFALVKEGEVVNPISGTTGVECDEQPIIKNNKMTARDGLNFTEGTGEIGELKFEAYVCQAAGFDSAAAAFKACFLS